MTMRKLATLILFACIAPADPAHGQAYGELTINDVRARFHAHGLIGYDPGSSTTGFEVPAGSGTHALFTAGLWAVGIDSGSGPRGAAMMFEPAGESDYYPGPLTTDGSAATTLQVMNAYDQVWSVTRAEVAAHLAYFNCLADPDCDEAMEYPDGYETPASILNWPAMNPYSGYAPYLAPFFDHNNDGAYTPATGDVPCILGDEALFFVFNDKGGPHVFSTMLPIGLEVQAMPFAYHAPGTWKDQTIFVRYHLINRGLLTLGDTRIGMFNDFDLGCGNDDFAGTDPSRNLAYIYNNDDQDESCMGAAGYGTQPPAFGQVILKGSMLDANTMDDAMANTLPAWNGNGFGDATVDNERSGLSRFMAMHRDAPSCCNDPAQSGHFYNYLNSHWKDGTPLTYGGNGYSLEPDALPCAFMYPGDDDPVDAGTDGTVQDAWSESDPSNPDRRCIASMAPFTLEPGEHIDLLLAYVYARAESGGSMGSVQALQARVDSVRAFAADLPVWNSLAEDGFNDQCTDLASLSMEEPVSSALHLFPIPASEAVRLDVPRALVGSTLRIQDMAGRPVATQRLVGGLNTIDIAGLANGVYTCEVRGPDGMATARLIKQ